MRLLRWTAAGAAVLAVCWSVGWHLLEPMAEARLKAESEKLAARGVFVEVDDLEISGFPFRFDIAVLGARVAAPRQGVSLAFERAVVSYGLGAPFEGVVAAPDRIQFARRIGSTSWRGEIRPQAASATLRRLSSGVYSLDARLDGAEIAARSSDGALIWAEFGAASVDATASRSALSLEADIEAAGGRMVLGAASSTPDAELALEAVSARVDVDGNDALIAGRIAAVRLSDFDGDAPAEVAAALTALQTDPAAVDPADIETGTLPDTRPPAAERPAEQARKRPSQARVALRRFLEGGGVVKIEGAIDAISIRRSLPSAAAPMEHVAFDATELRGDVELSAERFDLRGAAGPMSGETQSSDDRSLTFEIDGAAGLVDAPFGAAERAGETVKRRVDVEFAFGEVRFDAATLDRLHLDAPHRLAPDQGMKIHASADLDVRANPLLARLGAADDANGPAARLSAARLETFEFRLLDLAVDGTGAFAADAGRGEATFLLTDWRSFFEKFARAGVFEPPVVGLMAMMTGAFAAPTDRPEASKVSVSYADGQISLNGKPLTR